MLSDIRGSNPEFPARNVSQANAAIHIDGLSQIWCDFTDQQIEGFLAGGAVLLGKAEGAVFTEADFRGATLGLTGRYTIAQSNVAFAEFADDQVTLIGCEEDSLFPQGQTPYEQAELKIPIETGGVNIKNI